MQILFTHLHTIKLLLPLIEHYYYFSGGATSLYKNYINLANFMYYEQEHQMSAEWHFFTTSHRRSPCNGIGGAVKVLTANASLQGKKRSFE